MVDRCAGHTILASHRTFAAHWTGNISPHPVWLACAGQHPSTVCSPGGTAFVLQHCGFHSHGYRHVLPHVSCKAGCGKGRLHMRVAITPGVHVLTMSSGFPWMRVGHRAYFFCCLMSFLLVCSLSVQAHDHHGPPTRIMTDERVGPWTISVWVQQQMENGKIFVKVRPSSGTAVPDDLKVEIGVQPASQNSSVTFYRADREA